jgi:hypothetical protein
MRTFTCRSTFLYAHFGPPADCTCEEGPHDVAQCGEACHHGLLIGCPDVGTWGERDIY